MSRELCDVNAIHPDKIINAKKNMANKSDLSAVSDLYKIFGDFTRTKILSALDSGEMCVCDLAYLLGMTKSAISHQLAILKKYNLVMSRKEGKNVFYTLSDSHIKIIIEMGLEHIREDKNEKNDN